MATSGSGGNLMFSAGISFAKTGQATDKEINAELNRIQHLINSKQLWVKLGIDPSSQVFLKNYGKSADELEKKMRLVAKAIQDLQKRGKYWDANGMTAQAQRLQQTYHELSVLRKTSSLKANEFEKMIIKNINEEVKAQERAQKAAERKAEAMRRAAEKQAQALNKVNGLFGVQDGYIQNVIARMAAYASLGAIGGFLTKIREVTAEFELQRISLGAIIQDQNRANALFSEIKSYALKSPVKILDLTRYTKQLAAYQIETEKLFETTKRLTDVSVGLGVDMSRLILAYGETKASHVLNAKELRQFAMMGIPMLELLSEKLSEINGKTITTAETFQMIKKRMVGFDVVAQVFEDLTNKGGIFYNMQEKQGNTLFGMWAKLGDAVSVMYDQIGNTGWVNAGMRGFINVLRELMLAWRDIGRAMLVASIGFLAFKANSAILGFTMNRANALTVAINRLSVSQMRLNTAVKSGNELLIMSNQLKTAAALASLRAARSNGFWHASILKLKAAWLSFSSILVSNAPMLAITAIVAAIQIMSSYYDKLNRLKEALADIQSSAKIEVGKSVQNFESLANQAVNARDGSKEQRDALEELHTTYGKIIPAQDLQIEKLRAMAGNYDLLTEAIRNNVAAQKMQEGMTTIVEDYAAKEKKWSDKIRKNLIEKGIGYWMVEDGEVVKKELKVLDTQYDRMIKNVEKLARTTSMSMRDIWKQVLEGEGFEPLIVDRINNVDFLQNSNEFIIKLREEENALNDWKKTMKETYSGLEKFAENLERAKERIEKADYTAKAGTFEFSQQQVRESVNAYSDEIREALKDQKSKINLDDFITVDEQSVEKLPLIDFEKLIEAIDAESTPLKDQLIKLVEAVQQEWDGLVPKDPIVRSLRSKLIEITNSYKDAGITMENMRQYFWDGSTEMKKQLKQYEDSLNVLTADIYAHEKQLEKYGAATLLMWAIQGYSLDKQKAEAKALSEYIEAFKYYLDPNADKKNKGKQSDPRLQILNNIASTMEKINKEYDDLLKKEGQTKALADTQRLFAEEFANLQKIANKYKFKLPAFEVPKNASEVKQWYDAIIKEIKRLKIKDADKVLIDLGFKANKAEIDELQKQIEQKLKNLQSRIEQSKTAKEFYDKILSATGDVDIAANVTMSIYGDTGEGIDAQMAKYIKEMFAGHDVEVPVSVIADNNQINYKALAEFVRKNEKALGGVDSKTYQELLKIAQQGQKDWAKTYEGYLKDLEKAKTYSDKRVELAKKTAEKIKEIQNSQFLSDSQKEKKTLGYQEKEAKEAANLAYEAFKDSPMYVQMFEDLDYASTTMLKNMKARLQDLQGEWKNLSPQNLKEMQKRLDEINKQLIKRNPFKTLSDAIKEYKKLSKEGSYKDAEKNLEEWEDKRQKAWEELEKQSKIDPNSDLTKAAKDLYDYAVKNAEAAEKLMERWQRVKEIIKLSVTELFKVLDMFGQVAHGIADLTENFGGSEEDVQYWNDIAAGLDAVSSGIQDIITSALQGNVMGIISSALSAIPKMIIGFTQIFDAGKIRRANKEIKRQQQILEQLEYTYSRLQNAADKLFGTDYIQNYNQQLKNLQAQAEAYQKQADAERSKGKKADKEKIKEYENAAREAKDKIADMRAELTNFFLGTDESSAARDFAQAWIEAKASFESTTDAIKSKYKDMIKNMVIEGAAAKIIDSLLAPMWNKFDTLLQDGQIDTAINELVNGMDTFVKRAENGMNVLYNSLLAKGIDLQEILSDSDTNLTGIARDIATASEESINGLAQGINTQNYYISHVPTISENVAAIRILMEGGAVAQVGGDLVGMQNEHLAQLPIIAANTLATAERCERAALACEEMADNIRRVVETKGGTFVLRTTLN